MSLKSSLAVQSFQPLVVLAITVCDDVHLLEVGHAYVDQAFSELQELNIYSYTPSSRMILHLHAPEVHSPN